MKGPRRSRILIADDERLNRLVLRRCLAENHDVIEACNGREAIAKATLESPDLVLIDAQMPECDGYEATQAIKSLVGAEQFLPVIFMTAENDQSRLVRGLSCGGDDFLIKPINPVLLEGKIQALLRVRGVFETLRNQRDELSLFRKNAQRDFGVAEAVLNNVLSHNHPALPGVEFAHIPLETLNGDIILQSILPGGRLRVLLGDFTGHGLSAAIGAIPVAETFYGMARRNLPLDSMLREINERLHRILPRYLFLAACALEIDPCAGTLTLWNGGLPAVLIGSPAADAPRREPSMHLPLGVLPPAQFDPTCSTSAIRLGERLLVASDGVQEACDRAGEMFGEVRTEQAFLDPENGDRWVAGFLRSLNAFCGDATAHDDVTVFGLTMLPALRTALQVEQVKHGLGQYALRFERAFDPNSLREADPLATFRNMIETSPILVACRTEIDLVVTELFSNALEHGLLKLSSALKNDESGFEIYYRRRAQALARLEQGGIFLSLVVDGPPDNQVAVVRVADNGEGIRRGDPQDQPETLPWGKGLALVRGLCARVATRDGGRAVEAIFSLGHNAHQTGGPRELLPLTEADIWDERASGS